MNHTKTIPWLPEPGIEPEKIIQIITDLISEIYKYDEPIWATPDFLLLLDCINELSRTGDRPSKQLQEKYLSTLYSLAKDLVEEKRNHQEAQMDKKDVKLLYDAFVALCDYVEEDTGGGCLNCPLNRKICLHKANGQEFSQALARIRVELGSSTM